LLRSAAKIYPMEVSNFASTTKSVNGFGDYQKAGIFKIAAVTLMNNGDKSARELCLLNKSEKEKNECLEAIQAIFNSSNRAANPKKFDAIILSGVIKKPAIMNGFKVHLFHKYKERKKDEGDIFVNFYSKKKVKIRSENTGIKLGSAVGLGLMSQVFPFDQKRDFFLSINFKKEKSKLLLIPRFILEKLKNEVAPDALKYSLELTTAIDSAFLVLEQDGVENIRKALNIIENKVKPLLKHWKVDYKPKYLNYLTKLEFQKELLVAIEMLEALSNPN